jgi:hypothetical protein
MALGDEATTTGRQWGLAEIELQTPPLIAKAREEDSSPDQFTAPPFLSKAVLS